MTSSSSNGVAVEMARNIRDGDDDDDDAVPPWNAVRARSTRRMISILDRNRT